MNAKKTEEGESVLSELAAHRVNDIILMNSRLQEFWHSHGLGWAGSEAASHLENAKLDWQVQLSRTLSTWLTPGSPGDCEGRLILAWANLGVLVEGTLRWFLCVYHGDYSRNPLRTSNGDIVEPPDIWFAKLCRFFEENVWDKLAEPNQRYKWAMWVDEIRRRRNSIHAFNQRDIATHDEWLKQVCNYWQFLKEKAMWVPYPDEEPLAPYELTSQRFWDIRDEDRGIPLSSHHDLYPLIP